MQVQIPYVLYASRFASVPAGLIPAPSNASSDSTSKSTESTNAE